MFLPMMKRSQLLLKSMEQISHSYDQLIFQTNILAIKRLERIFFEWMKENMIEADVIRYLSATVPFITQKNA